jgi:hypothetical protein
LNKPSNPRQAPYYRRKRIAQETAALEQLRRHYPRALAELTDQALAQLVLSIIPSRALLELEFDDVVGRAVSPEQRARLERNRSLALSASKFDLHRAYGQIAHRKPRLARRQAAQVALGRYLRRNMLSLQELRAIVREASA